MFNTREIQIEILKKQIKIIANEVTEQQEMLKKIVNALEYLLNESEDKQKQIE